MFVRSFVRWFVKLLRLFVRSFVPPGGVKLEGFFSFLAGRVFFRSWLGGFFFVPGWEVFFRSGPEQMFRFGSKHGIMRGSPQCSPARTSDQLWGEGGCSRIKVQRGEERVGGERGGKRLFRRAEFNRAVITPSVLLGLEVVVVVFLVVTVESE